MCPGQPREGEGREEGEQSQRREGGGKRGEGGGRLFLAPECRHLVREEEEKEGGGESSIPNHQRWHAKCTKLSWNMYTHCVHIFALLAPIFMLSR